MFLTLHQGDIIVLQAVEGRDSILFMYSALITKSITL